MRQGLNGTGLNRTPVIAAVEADSYEILAGRANAGLIVLCDHACNAFPEGYGTLGLEPKELERHIAYDIGASAVTRQLAATLECPALLTRFSRLLIDPNRGMDAVRDLQRAVEELGVKAATAFPAGLYPQVPINDA